MKPLYAFIDTNIFLHYQPFDQIKWTEILDSTNVVLIATPVVIRELDEHKDQHRISGIRDRARTALKKIEQIDLEESSASLPDGVGLKYVKEPAIDFQQYGLRVETNDDHLIASCLAHLEAEPETDIVLVAGDTGLRLKARQHEIKAVELPEKYKLQSAIDSIEKENKQLQRRVQQLENRFPKLKLAFADGANQFRVTLPIPLSVPEERIQQQMENIKRKHSKRQDIPKDKPQEARSRLEDLIQNPNLMSRAIGDPTQPSPKEIERYNSALDKFYEKYERYLREYSANVNVQRRTIRLDIYLFNYGTAPAEDIDVFLHFPDGFDLYDENDRPQTPEVPEPPRSPRIRSEMLYPTLDTRALSYLNRPFPSVPIQSNVSAPEIKRSNSYDVSYEVQRLKQHMNEPCDPLYVVFDSFENTASFRIDYRINSADLPDETNGSLNVVVAHDST